VHGRKPSVPCPAHFCPAKYIVSTDVSVPCGLLLDKLMEMGAVAEAIIGQGLRAQIGKKFVRSRRQVESLFDGPAV
jgi:hypothetical protein